MKRILFLICALLLLTDLTDDGYPGKALLLAPQCPGKISFTSSQDSLGEIAPQARIPFEKELGILQPWHNQLVSVEAHDAASFINFYFCSSSGGLPL